VPDEDEAAIKRLAHDVDDADNDADPARMAGYRTDSGININPFGDRFEGRARIEAASAASTPPRWSR
jgi:ketosteroid isomerase-like protein